MEKKSRSRAVLLKLCSYEKAIIRSICVFVALLVASTAFSGFCSVNENNDESKQIKSTTIDFAASAGNIATFRNQYNTLQTGNGNTIAAPEDIKFSKEAIGDAVESMYSAAASLNSRSIKASEVSKNENEQKVTAPETASAISEHAATEPATRVPAATAAHPKATKNETTVPETAAPSTTAQPQTEVSTASSADHALTAAASVSTISVKTPPSTLMLDENGVPTEYRKVISGNASAYAGDGRTATGTVPVPGSIAVNPRIIPYGTKMWIVSNDGSYVYGYAVAEDTGGFIYWSNAPIADLFFDSEWACNAFGRRDITIYILD